MCKHVKNPFSIVSTSTKSAHVNKGEKSAYSDITSQKLLFPHLHDTTAHRVFEYLHPGRGFSKDSFSVTLNYICVWAKGKNTQKKPHFETYKAWALSVSGSHFSSRGHYLERNRSKVIIELSLLISSQASRTYRQVQYPSFLPVPVLLLW